MKRRPRAFWVELVAELEAGAAPGDVARRHKVRETTLRWWRTELRRSASGPRLLPVIAGPAERNWARLSAHLVTTTCAMKLGAY